MSNWDCCGALHQQDELSYPQYEFYVFINCCWWQQMLQLNNENVKLYPKCSSSLMTSSAVFLFDDRTLIFSGLEYFYLRQIQVLMWKCEARSYQQQIEDLTSIQHLWALMFSPFCSQRSQMSALRSQTLFSTFKYFYLFLFSVLIDNKTNRWCVDPL